VKNIALAALYELAQNGQFPPNKLPATILTLGLDLEKKNPIVL